MGETLTVRLDEATLDWLTREADRHGRSKAWVLEQSVRAARGSDSVYPREEDAPSHRGDPPAGHSTEGDLQTRVDDLENRVAELEARQSARDALAEERYTVDDETADTGDNAVPPRGDGRDQPSDTSRSGEGDESDDELE